ncbi:uncharacterized protein [Temnothorax nylanderi]|uniref:uncharacterized protein n=1 Tax=Temnothorax nylanderi TaxID=102681 RepID=UPI003A8AD7BF
MSFLSNSMEPRPTSSTLSTNESGPPPTPPSPIEPVSVPLYVSTHSALESPASTCSNNANVNSSKRKKIHLEEADSTTVVNKPAEKNGVYHFVMRLAGGLRRLSSRERAKLEIEFLSKIMEVKERLELDNV